MEGVGLGEAELDLLIGVFVEDIAHGIEFVLNLLSIHRIKIHLDVLLSIQSDSGVSSSNGCWENLHHQLNSYMNLRYLPRQHCGQQ